MKNRFFQIAGAAALAAGLLVGQNAGTTNPAPHDRGQWVINRATKALNLTSDQQTKLQEIITGFHTASQPLHQKLKADEAALMTAAKTNPGQINAAAAVVGADLTSLTAARAQAFSNFYAILTPAQQQQVDSAGHMMLFGGGHRGFGRGR